MWVDSDDFGAGFKAFVAAVPQTNGRSPPVWIRLRRGLVCKAPRPAPSLTEVAQAGGKKPDTWAPGLDLRSCAQFPCTICIADCLGNSAESCRTRPMGTFQNLACCRGPAAGVPRPVGWRSARPVNGGVDRGAFSSRLRRRRILLEGTFLFSSLPLPSRRSFDIPRDPTNHYFALYSTSSPWKDRQKRAQLFSSTHANIYPLATVTWTILPQGCTHSFCSGGLFLCVFATFLVLGLILPVKRIEYSS